MNKALIGLMFICFFIGFCLSALILSPVVYEKGLSAGCPCNNNYNFSFNQEIEVFYEGQYNLNDLV